MQKRGGRDRRLILKFVPGFKTTKKKRDGGVAFFFEANIDGQKKGRKEKRGRRTRFLRLRGRGEDYCPHKNKKEEGV